MQETVYSAWYVHPLTWLLAVSLKPHASMGDFNKSFSLSILSLTNDEGRPLQNRFLKACCVCIQSTAQQHGFLARYARTMSSSSRWMRRKNASASRGLSRIRSSLAYHGAVGFGAAKGAALNSSLWSGESAGPSKRGKNACALMRWGTASAGADLCNSSLFSPALSLVGVGVCSALRLNLIEMSCCKNNFRALECSCGFAEPDSSFG